MEKGKIELEVKVRGMLSNNDLNLKLKLYDEKTIVDIKNNILNLIQPFIKEPQSYVIYIRVFKGTGVLTLVESLEILASYTCTNGFWHWEISRDEEE